MRHIFLIVLTALLLAVTSCANGSNTILPVNNFTPNSQDRAMQSQTHLWGYYDVYIDIANKTARAVENRNAMFTANVVNFVNSKPANLGFKINSTPVGSSYADVDIDVSITHPFPGLPEYNGYDVRGLFMGDGSASLKYNPDLIYPALGTDQLMLADPADGRGGPDGYTRWFNKPEFSTGGSPLFSYTKGKLASAGFNGSATLNAYKYFADGLAVNDNLWTWLNANAGQHGQFSSGATCTRNYYLRFPNSKGVTFGYAIVANWEGVEPVHHPSNAPEAISCSVNDKSDVWYTSPTQNGGNLSLDVSVFNWKHQPSTIFIESSVLSSPHKFTTAEMTPIGGSGLYSTYQADIPADSITNNIGQEYWVIVEQGANNYANDFGVSNLAGTDTLAAFFRYDLAVSNTAPVSLKVLSPDGGETLWMAMNYEIKWNPGSSGIANIKIEWSTDNFVSDIRTIVASTPNDGSYIWQPIPNVATTSAKIRISDVLGTASGTSQNNFNIALPVWLNFQPSVTVTSSSVTWNSYFGVNPYDQSYDEFSPALSQDLNGLGHISWHREQWTGSTRWAWEVTIRSTGGTAWNGEGGMFMSNGGGLATPLRGDFCKVAPASNNSTFMAICCLNTYYSVDVDRYHNGDDGNWNSNSFYTGLYKNCEIMADSGYVYLVGDGHNGDLPGIVSVRVATPNFVWPAPGPFNSIVATGEVSHSRSWALQSGKLMLIYYTNAGQIKLAKQTNQVTDVWDDTEVVFDGTGYTGCTDPAISLDGDGRLFAIWTGKHTASGEYRVLASMKATPTGSWGTPIVAASSTTSFDELHVSASTEKVLLPTGDSEYPVLIGYELNKKVQSQISPKGLWSFLPTQEVNNTGEVATDPDTLCMKAPYTFDALFTWATEITPGVIGVGNRDVKFRNADFKTP